MQGWADSLQSAAREAAEKLQNARDQAVREVAENLQSAREHAEQQARALQQTASAFEANMLFPGEELPARTHGAASRAERKEKDGARRRLEDSKSSQAEVDLLRGAILSSLSGCTSKDSSEALAESLHTEIGRLRESIAAYDGEQSELSLARSQLDQLKQKLSAVSTAQLRQQKESAARLSEIESRLTHRDEELRERTAKVDELRSEVQRLEQSETELKQ